MEPFNFYGLSEVQKLILTSKKKLMAKSKFSLSVNKMISFMKGDFEKIIKCAMMHIINIGIFYERIFCDFSIKDVNILKSQLSKGKLKCRIADKALEDLLLIISIYKAYADVINACDNFYFSKKTYDEECGKIYNAIDIAVKIGLMSQYEQKLCCDNVKYSYNFLKRCINDIDDIVTKYEYIKIIKIGYLSSQNISHLEHSYRINITTIYLSFYTHTEKVMKVYEENKQIDDFDLYRKKNYDFPMEINLLLFYLKKYIDEFNELIKKNKTTTIYKYIVCVFIKLYIYIHNISITSENQIYSPHIMTGVIGSCLGDLFETSKLHDIDMHYVMLYTILNDVTIAKRKLYEKCKNGEITHDEYLTKIKNLTNEQLPYYLKIDDFIDVK